MSKEKAILNFLNQSHAYSPTIREIGEAVGLRSSSTVHMYLKRLEKQGFIERQLGCPRCISVVHGK
ncbi:LexA family protein [Sporomusa aerivorans]|uniref:LexA family protein n=1 Tax=Sporomusa aerivorans TaxID=204936 RepID=UPI00352B3485